MEEQTVTEMDDLDRELAEAQGAASAAALTPVEVERARKLAALEDAKATRRTAETARRRIAGKRLEAEAKKVAAGKYTVEYFDLGKHFPDADMKTLPGAGVLVIRSHPTAAKTTFDTDVEHKNGPGAKKLGEIFTDLVCASTVYPAINDPKAADGVEGIRFRAFLESDLGAGMPAQIGAAVLRLGGAHAEEVKRAT